jgi:hypothetical protein
MLGVAGTKLWMLTKRNFNREVEEVEEEYEFLLLI